MRKLLILLLLLSTPAIAEEINQASPQAAPASNSLKDLVRQMKQDDKIIKSTDEAVSPNDTPAPVQDPTSPAIAAQPVPAPANQPVDTAPAPTNTEQTAPTSERAVPEATPNTIPAVPLNNSQALGDVEQTIPIEPPGDVSGEVQSETLSNFNSVMFKQSDTEKVMKVFDAYAKRKKLSGDVAPEDLGIDGLEDALAKINNKEQDKRLPGYLYLDSILFASAKIPKVWLNGVKYEIGDVHENIKLVGATRDSAQFMWAITDPTIDMQSMQALSENNKATSEAPVSVDTASNQINFSLKINQWLNVEQMKIVEGRTMSSLQYGMDSLYYNPAERKTASTAKSTNQTSQASKSDNIDEKLNNELNKLKVTDMYPGLAPEKVKQEFMKNPPEGSLFSDVNSQNAKIKAITDIEKRMLAMADPAVKSIVNNAIQSKLPSVIQKARNELEELERPDLASDMQEYKQAVESLLESSAELEKKYEGSPKTVTTITPAPVN